MQLQADVVIVGGGLAGVATAYELQSRGLATILVEARHEVALETSFANGGMLTPSMPDPWNGPGVVRQLLTSLVDPDAALKLRLRTLPTLGRWGIAFLRNASSERHRAAARANFLLARYSLECTGTRAQALGLHYDAAAKGSIKLFRDAAALSSSLAVAAALRDEGLLYEQLDRDAAIALEPALEPIREGLVGAIHYPGDAVGDARKFCLTLLDAYCAAGGQVRVQTQVCGLKVQGEKVVGVSTKDGELIRADRTILAAGVQSHRLLKAIGLRLPVEPIKGYSLTFDLPRRSLPARPVIDDSLRAAIVPIGSRLRIAGTAELAGHDISIPQERISNLFRMLGAVYPDIAEGLDSGAGSAWAGLRPVSADGIPFIGPTKFDGLYLNTGHGHLGWTCAAGSAAMLADLIERRRPEVEASPYLPARARL